MINNRHFARFCDAAPPMTSAGNNIVPKVSAVPNCDSRFAAFLVEMLMTTSTAELPGVTGVEGLNAHCAPAGNPPVHASVTAPANELPTGCTLNAYGPEVWPAITV